MEQEQISICGHQFQIGIEHFSFPWNVSRIPDMAELARLKDFPNLTSVSLNSTNLNDRGLEFIAQCPLVDNINLQETKVSSNGIAHLAQLKKLQHLRLKDNRQLGSECVVHLNKLEALVDLQVHGTSIGKKGLAILQLPNLRYLMVNKARRDALVDLSERNPQCNVLVKGKAEFLNGELLWEK